ncbi:MAG TPA: PAS domain-containing protein [Candidatus Baltobacteraceae bacterium]|nr:PAS domain-containing protein [Candidatus Baltobacteraceae bacterium]
MLEELADSTVAVIFVKDAAGKYVFINRGYELVHRVSRTAYLGSTDYDVFPKEEADRFRQADRRVIESREVLVEEERRTYADGVHSLVVVKFPLVDAKGDVYGVCGVATDVSQRIEAEARMRMLSAAVDRASDMIAMFEWTPLREWRIFYVNEMFLRMTGYERSDVIGHTSRFLEGPRTNVEESNRRRALLAQGIPCRAEVAYYRRDGSVFWVELNARPLRGADGSVTHTIVLYRDITEKRVTDEMQSLEETGAEDGLQSARYLHHALESAAHDARVNERAHSLLWVALEPLADRATVSRLLHENLRSEDVPARMESGDVAVLLRHCTSAQGRRVAQSFAGALSQCGIRAHAGVAEISGDGSAQHVLDAARQACEAAKQAGAGAVYPA